MDCKSKVTKEYEYLVLLFRRAGLQLVARLRSSNRSPGRVLRNSGSVEKKCGSKLNLGSRFPLNQLSYILFAILLYLLSVRQKVAKNSAQNKISHNSLLLASRKQHPSVGCYLPLKALRCHSGAPGLVRFSIINKKNNAAALQTFLALPLNGNGLQL